MSEGSDRDRELHAAMMSGFMGEVIEPFKTKIVDEQVEKVQPAPITDEDIYDMFGLDTDQRELARAYGAIEEVRRAMADEERDQFIAMTMATAELIGQELLLAMALVLWLTNYPTPWGEGPDRIEVTYTVDDPTT
jgi:hypothetical protein